jgi:tetratricopeptide (TPR) repeat protein
MTFNVIAIIVVAAMIIGTLGAVVISDWLNSNDDGDAITLDDNDVDEIEQGYRDAVAANPQSTEALVALASYLGNVGKGDEAINYYQQAIDINPADVNVRLSFATTLSAIGKYPDAELQYQKILEAEPNNGTALLGLARLYRRMSPPRTDDAITYYKLTIERAPGSSAAILASEELAFVTGTPVASPQASPQASPSPF